MKKLIASLLFSGIGFVSMAQTFKIDTEKAVVRFNYYKHEVVGTVKGIAGDITFDVNDLTKSSFQGTADVKSISTENKQRDAHLMEPDYFDAAKFPQMKFRSSEVTQVEDGYKMTGILTIKDIEQKVEFKFTFNANLFEGKATIYSNDFGIAKEKKYEDSKISIKVYVPVF